MKRVLILGSNLITGKNDSRVISDTIKNKLPAEDEVLNGFFEDLVFDVKTNSVKIYDFKSGEDLKQFNLIIALNWYASSDKAPLKDIALSLAYYLKKHEVNFWNTEMLKQRSTTKLSSMVQLALEGFDVPHTIFSLNNQVLQQEQTNLIDYPVICKALAASRGKYNYKINSSEELQNCLNSSQRAMMIQEYIPNNQDIRIICFGGKPKLAIRRSRTNPDTHLNNTSQGANAELINLQDLPEEILTNSPKISIIMHRELAGIDYIISDDQKRIVCLEVNAIPQLTSGSFVTEKLDEFSRSVQEFLT